MRYVHVHADMVFSSSGLCRFGVAERILQDLTMSMPNSRSCSACIAQRARSRTIGCPGRPARTDFTSIRTLAVLERSCSKSHFIPFANATSQTMPLR
jgi:hypothetical protein